VQFENCAPCIAIKAAALFALGNPSERSQASQTQATLTQHTSNSETPNNPNPNLSLADVENVISRLQNGTSASDQELIIRTTKVSFPSWMCSIKLKITHHHAGLGRPPVHALPRIGCNEPVVDEVNLDKTARSPRLLRDARLPRPERVLSVPTQNNIHR